MTALLDILRDMRYALYRFTSSTFLGIQIDVPLHFFSGLLIYWIVARRAGMRRAAWVLGGLILLKEVLDLFLKSHLSYIDRPTPDVVVDIITDIIAGALGGLVAWWWLRRRRRRAVAGAVPSRS